MLSAQQIHFLGSSSSLKNCPRLEIPEYAFVGRSNVGKSSLINALCGSKNLAKISSTPGKTKLINHFSVESRWSLVDLPGYGYVKASERLRRSFSSMLTEYLERRTNLVSVFCLIDIRLKPQEIDIRFLSYMGNRSIPFAIVFTKTDKLSASQVNKNLSVYLKEIAFYWENPPLYFLTSSLKRKGISEIVSHIERCNIQDGKR